MDDIISELQGLREEINWHDWSDLEADRSYLASRLVILTDHMINLARQVANKDAAQQRLNHTMMLGGPRF